MDHVIILTQFEIYFVFLKYKVKTDILLKYKQDFFSPIFISNHDPDLTRHKDYLFIKYIILCLINKLVTISFFSFFF